MDLMNQAKDSMGAIEKVVYGLPGITGYKEKELRREADRAVRQQLVRRLEDQRLRLTNLQTELLSSGGLGLMDDMERVNIKLQVLIDSVRTASYGYAPLFDLVRVKEEQLDALVAFDERLMADVDRIAAIVDNMSILAGRPETEWLEAIRALSTTLDKLNTDFTHRSEVILQVGPSEPSE